MKIVKAEVRDAFTGELISQHQMVGMNGICFNVPVGTVRISINWENVSECVNSSWHNAAQQVRPVHCPDCGEYGG